MRLSRAGVKRRVRCVRDWVVEVEGNLNPVFVGLFVFVFGLVVVLVLPVVASLTAFHSAAGLKPV